MDVLKLRPILAAFNSCGVTNEFLKRAILANIEKESGGEPKEENLNYSNTSNDRIRKIFGTRVSALSDAQLSEVKKTPEKFAELVYGKGNALGRSMGNLEEGDGWKYRGRGYIQLTGKNNYKFYADRSGYDIFNNPDLLIIDRNISAIVSVLFVLTGLKDQVTFPNQFVANRAVTQVIGGRGLNLDVGYGSELLKKVNQFSTKYKLD
jgi:predicted chitinase